VEKLSVILAGTLVALAGWGFARAADLETRADLNGDGKAERVAVEAEQDHLLVRIGEARHEVPLPAFNLHRLDVSSLSAPDRVQVIRLRGEHDGGAGAELLFVMQGDRIHALGEFGPLEVPGNGIVYESRWQGFWSLKERYSYDPAAHRLVATPQELYAVGVDAAAKAGLRVGLRRGKGGAQIRIKPGSQVRILAADLSACRARESGQGCTRYLVRTSSGLLGWVDEGALDRGLANLPWAG